MQQEFASSAIKQGFRDRGFYKGFLFFEKRASILFSDYRSLGVRAILPASPCRGRLVDIVFEGSSRKVKADIRAYWAGKKEIK